MESREFEVMILKEAKKIKPQLMIIPFQDLRYSPKLKIPRVVSRTTITQDTTFVKRVGLVSKEVTIYRYTTNLTFVLDNTMDRDDIVDIHKYLKHSVKNNWASNRSGEYVIHEITDIIDISDIVSDGITQRFNFEIIATIQKEEEFKLDEIKDIEFTIEKGGVNDN